MQGCCVSFASDENNADCPPHHLVIRRVVEGATEIHRRSGMYLHRSQSSYPGSSSDRAIFWSFPLSLTVIFLSLLSPSFPFLSLRCESYQSPTTISFFRTNERILKNAEQAHKSIHSTSLTGAAFTVDHPQHPTIWDVSCCTFYIDVAAVQTMQM